MTAFAPGSVEDQIAQWRGYLLRRRSVSGTDVDELETHLRDQIAALGQKGLAPEEAFLVAVKRLGSVDALSREFAREHSERLWKQLVIGSAEADGRPTSARAGGWVALGFAVAAATAVKVPALFGMRMDGPDPVILFYFRNASLFVFPLLALYFLWKRAAGVTAGLRLLPAFVAGAVFANLYYFQPTSDTGVLTVLHLPIALWLAVGFAYFGGHWLGGIRRMDFVRYSGELAIYFVLIALGGGVFSGFTAMIFRAININAGRLVAEWLIPCGAAGAVLIGSWLVEAKQSVIENMAPVLTRIFTPLFTVLLLGFLATMLWTGHPIDVQRELLIGFDLLLAVVVGLVLYAASARDPQTSPDFFDALQLLLMLSALAVDAVALVAIGSRIAEFGFTPNRVAALGENLILLVNLAGAAWLGIRFQRGRGPFAALERWLVACLPVYSAWAALVVILFPPIFGYR